MATAPKKPNLLGGDGKDKVGVAHPQKVELALGAVGQTLARSSPPSRC